MSSITLPSFIDDGHSFTRRLHPSHSVAKWLHTTPSPATSTYTGSYIDDGLDLLPSHGPGFGAPDPHLYTKQRREQRSDGPWNEDIARAVGGDIERSLAKLRGVAGVEVKHLPVDARGERRRREKKGVVFVRAPLRWGTFVIKEKNGRCVVVDEEGEYDSGRPDEESRARESKRWVEAARSPSPPVYRPAEPRENAARQNSSREKESKTCRGSKTKTSRRAREGRRPGALSPVFEADHYLPLKEDDPLTLSAASPTDFFMTGGLSGWPSPTKQSRTTSSKRGPTVPHAITWDSSASPLTRPARSAPASVLKSHSPSIHILPHGWPSPPASPARSACSSSFTHLDPRSSGKRSSRSRQQSGSKRTECNFEHEGRETRSNYQTPDVIEVVYDETPPGEVSYSQAGWDEKAVSARSWSEASKDRQNHGGAWERAADVGTVKSFGKESAESDLGWASSAKGASWKSKADSRSASVRGWSNGGKKGDEWDGFERPKTASEVSVAGSGSERSWPASQHSILTHSTRRSQASHGSKRSSLGVSQADSAVPSEHNWPASVHGSERSRHSWTNSKHGSEKSSRSKYQNGFDEDNATYLNETWGGVPVRVASPHKSVAGWD